ncbi:MAG: hypothetical protein WDO13_00585 [Verrucomicrobiota bacterium]
MSPDDAGVALADLAKGDVQSAIIVVPPSDRNPEKLARSMAGVDGFLTEMARRYAGNGPGKLHFYELGNEPDLHFFYPGSMADYLAAFYSMRQAIKDGAAQAGLSDKDTLVYNGGLAFVHPEGGRRSRELVALLDPTKIDAIAYHGHGPGIAAERNAWERLHDELVKDNKGGLVQVETESGLMASDREGSLAQARTVVEKMVYAESKGEPTLMFFRLFMGGGESAYSMTENLVEPRPSVLSYREMVERLRHFRFIKTLDFSGKSKISDADGFLFAEQNAQGAWTGRKVVVAFCEKPHQADVRVQMAPAGVTCREAGVYDMFGNASPVDNVIGNVAPLALRPDPVYLAWNSSNSPDTIEATPAPIQILSLDPLLEGASTEARFAVTNPLPQSVASTLTLQPAARIPVQADPGEKGLTLPAGQGVSVPITLTAVRAASPWTCRSTGASSSTSTRRAHRRFAPFPSRSPVRTAPCRPLGLVARPPDRLCATCRGIRAKAPGDRLRLSRFARRFDLELLRQRRLVDGVVRQRPKGMRHARCRQSGRQPSFHAPLKAGRNLIVVEVLAGKLGWQLNYSGPKELAAAGGHDPDRLALTLSADGKTLAQQTLPLELEVPLPRLRPEESPDRLETWLPLEPLTVLGSGAVKNLWFQEPDQSRWYKGEQDLSATAWMRPDEQNLQLYIAVTDDRLVQAPTPADLSKNDSLRVVISSESGKPLLDLTCGLVANQTASTGNPAGATCSVQRDEATTQTLYRVTLPKTLVGTTPFRLNFSVADNDEDYLKQTLECGDVNNPKGGFRLRCN